MMYGDVDYGKSVDIATRCGQDSDCNPASVGGILATMLGYSNIPEYWNKGLDKVEDREFPYLTMTLNDVYDIGLSHALQMVALEGGSISEKEVNILVQEPVAVQFEQCFEGLYPVDFTETNKASGIIQLNTQDAEFTYNFTGAAIVVNGRAAISIDGLPERVLELDVWVDGEILETVKMPTNYRTRKLGVYWNYDLPQGEHTIKLLLKNAKPGYEINVNRIIVYESKN